MQASADRRLATAVELHRAGRLAEAEKLYRAVLQRSPRDPDVLYLLGLTAIAASRHQRAADLLARSIRLRPGFAPAHLNLGIVLAVLNRPGDALASYDAAIACAPDLADAHYNRGFLLKQMGQLDAAVASLDRALALRPDDVEALNNRGLVLDGLKQHAEALATFDRALTLQPDFAQVLANRGNTLNWLRRPNEALDSFDRALALRPGLAETWCNRGDTLHEQGHFDDALASFDQAVALQPTLAEAHYGRSLTLLMLGRYKEGFRQYEWRRQRAGAAPISRSAPQPWLGNASLSGRTLLIRPELFLGDMIQFCRYALLATAQGARVTLAVPKPLLSLLHTLSPDVTVIDADAAPGGFDCHCPLMSLPRAFGTTLETIPAPVPYLRAAPERVAAWRQTLGQHGLKIGICWQGSASRTELERSFPLARFAPLSNMPGVRLISLQSGFGVEQLPDLPAVIHFDDRSDSGQRPFAETAAMMEAVDLVITTDTAIAHLAGALGRPTWIALRRVPDWRWGPSGDTTPWYPTARLFRQTTNGEWGDVFALMARALNDTDMARPG